MKQSVRKVYTTEFRSEAVRLALSSGCGVSGVSKDLGIGRSTLGKWVSVYREKELLSGPHDDVQKELTRLRRENDLLRSERDLLKKAAAFFASETRR